MKNLKSPLSISEIAQAQKMLASGATFSQLSKTFRRNKPTIKKSLDMWNTEVREAKLPSGEVVKFAMNRGRAMRVVDPKPELTKEEKTMEALKTAAEKLEAAK